MAGNGNGAVDTENSKTFSFKSGVRSGRTRILSGSSLIEMDIRWNGETTSGYFRQIFKENPKLLKKGTNATLLERWLKDLPGEKEVPKNVQAILHNLKSVLRKKLREKKVKSKQPEQPVAAAPAVESTLPKGRPPGPGGFGGAD